MDICYRKISSGDARPMKRYWVLVGLGLSIGILAAQEGSRLTVLSEPPHGAVQIDSNWIGYTPVHRLELLPGAYRIRVFAPSGGIWNLRDREFRIVLRPGQDTTLTVRFSPLIFVNSIPGGAFLRKDTTTIGLTPLYLSFYAYQGKQLVLEKPGYQPYRLVLQQAGPVTVRLKPKEGFVEQKRPPLLRLWPQTHRRAKFSLLGATVLTHWLAFYFKNVADDRYNRYLHTADPDLIDRYWRETQKYDRLTDITLALSYTSLAVFIYLVIWR